MTGDCSLAPDINQCPHFEPNKGKCSIKNECCGFYDKSKPQTEPKYIRQPRWYEKYYKKH
jgi:hypothetical protein